MDKITALNVKHTRIIVSSVVFCSYDIYRESEETIGRPGLLVDTIHNYISISLDDDSLVIDSTADVTQCGGEPLISINNLYLTGEDCTSE